MVIIIDIIRDIIVHITRFFTVIIIILIVMDQILKPGFMTLFFP